MRKRWLDVGLINKVRRKTADKLAWGTKLEYRGVMDLIEVDAVIERLQAFSDQLDLNQQETV